MIDYCAFSNDHCCIKWNDYILTRYELEEADQLLHGNWIEIQRLRDKIDLLEKMLLEAGIELPEDPFI